MFLNAQNQKQKQNQDQIKHAFNTLFHAQNDKNLNSLIWNTQFSFTHHLDQLRHQIPNPTPVTPQEYDAFRRRCYIIAANNKKLKQQILLIRNHFKHQFNIYDSDDSASLEETRITQRIKQIGTEIKGKILALKQKKQYMSRKTDLQREQMGQKVNRQTQKMLPVNLKMDQMKKGTEFLCRSLIQLKYDMEITEKSLKSSPEQEKRQQEKQRYY